MRDINIYIAGSFCDEKHRQSLKHMIEIVTEKFKKFRGIGYHLYVPMEFKVDGDFQKEDGTWNLPNHVWALRVFENDLEELNKADYVVAMYTGQKSTTGTAWEIGYAVGRGIPVMLYIPEWAKNNDMSLMVLNGADTILQEDGSEVADDCKNNFANFNQK